MVANVTNNKNSWILRQNINIQDTKINFKKIIYDNIKNKIIYDNIT